MADSDTKDIKKSKKSTKLQPPRLYKVLYINDDTTTVEFVVETLKIIFGHDQTTASALAIEINDAGSAVVAVLPYEIAETKGVEVTMLARHNGFPLQVRLEIE